MENVKLCVKCIQLNKRYKDEKLKNNKKKSLIDLFKELLYAHDLKLSNVSRTNLREVYGKYLIDGEQVRQRLSGTLSSLNELTGALTISNTKTDAQEKKIQDLEGKLRHLEFLNKQLGDFYTQTQKDIKKSVAKISKAKKKVKNLGKKQIPKTESKSDLSSCSILEDNDLNFKLSDEKTVDNENGKSISNDVQQCKLTGPNELNPNTSNEQNFTFEQELLKAKDILDCVSDCDSSFDSVNFDADLCVNTPNLDDLEIVEKSSESKKQESEEPSQSLSGRNDEDFSFIKEEIITLLSRDTRKIESLHKSKSSSSLIDSGISSFNSSPAISEIYCEQNPVCAQVVETNSCNIDEIDSIEASVSEIVVSNSVPVMLSPINSARKHKPSDKFNVPISGDESNETEIKLVNTNEEMAASIFDCSLDDNATNTLNSTETDAVSEQGRSLSNTVETLPVNIVDEEDVQDRVITNQSFGSDVKLKNTPLTIERRYSNLSSTRKKSTLKSKWEVKDNLNWVETWKPQDSNHSECEDLCSSFKKMKLNAVGGIRKKCDVKLKLSLFETVTSQAFPSTSRNSFRSRRTWAGDKIFGSIFSESTHTSRDFFPSYNENFTAAEKKFKTDKTHFNSNISFFKYRVRDAEDKVEFRQIEDRETSRKIQPVTVTFKMLSNDTATSIPYYYEIAKFTFRHSIVRAIGLEDTDTVVTSLTDLAEKLRRTADELERFNEMYASRTRVADSPLHSWNYVQNKESIFATTNTHIPQSVNYFHDAAGATCQCEKCYSYQSGCNANRFNETKSPCPAPMYWNRENMNLESPKEKSDAPNIGDLLNGSDRGPCCQQTDWRDHNLNIPKDKPIRASITPDCPLNTFLGPQSNRVFDYAEKVPEHLEKNLRKTSRNAYNLSINNVEPNVISRQRDNANREDPITSNNLADRSVARKTNLKRPEFKDNNMKKADELCKTLAGNSLRKSKTFLTPNNPCLAKINVLVENTAENNFGNPGSCGFNTSRVNRTVEDTSDEVETVKVKHGNEEQKVSCAKSNLDPDCEFSTKVPKMGVISDSNTDNTGQVIDEKTLEIRLTAKEVSPSMKSSHAITNATNIKKKDKSRYPGNSKPSRVNRTVNDTSDETETIEFQNGHDEQPRAPCAISNPDPDCEFSTKVPKMGICSSSCSDSNTDTSRQATLHYKAHELGLMSEKVSPHTTSKDVTSATNINNKDKPDQLGNSESGFNTPGVNRTVEDTSGGVEAIKVKHRDGTNEQQKIPCATSFSTLNCEFSTKIPKIGIISWPPSDCNNDISGQVIRFDKTKKIRLISENVSSSIKSKDAVTNATNIKNKDKPHHAGSSESCGFKPNGVNRTAEGVEAIEFKHCNEPIEQQIVPCAISNQDPDSEFNTNVLNMGIISSPSTDSNTDTSSQVTLHNDHHELELMSEEVSPHTTSNDVTSATNINNKPDQLGNSESCGFNTPVKDTSGGVETIKVKYRDGTNEQQKMPCATSFPTLNCESSTKVPKIGIISPPPFDCNTHISGQVIHSQTQEIRLISENISYPIESKHAVANATNPKNKVNSHTHNLDPASSQNTTVKHVVLGKRSKDDVNDSNAVFLRGIVPNVSIESEIHHAESKEVLVARNVISKQKKASNDDKFSSDVKNPNRKVICSPSSKFGVNEMSLNTLRETSIQILPMTQISVPLREESCDSNITEVSDDFVGIKMASVSKSLEQNDERKFSDITTVLDNIMMEYQLIQPLSPLPAVENGVADSEDNIMGLDKLKLPDIIEDRDNCNCQLLNSGSSHIGASEIEAPRTENPNNIHIVTEITDMDEFNFGKTNEESPSDKQSEVNIYDHSVHTVSSDIQNNEEFYHHCNVGNSLCLSNTETVDEIPDANLQRQCSEDTNSDFDSHITTEKESISLYGKKYGPRLNHEKDRSLSTVLEEINGNNRAKQGSDLNINNQPIDLESTTSKESCTNKINFCVIDDIKNIWSSYNEISNEIKIDDILDVVGDGHIPELENFPKGKDSYTNKVSVLDKVNEVQVAESDEGGFCSFPKDNDSYTTKVSVLDKVNEVQVAESDGGGFCSFPNDNDSYTNKVSVLDKVNEVQVAESDEGTVCSFPEDNDSYTNKVSVLDEVNEVQVAESDEGAACDTFLVGFYREVAETKKQDEDNEPCDAKLSASAVEQQNSELPSENRTLKRRTRSDHHMNSKIPRTYNPSKIFDCINESPLRTTLRYVSDMVLCDPSSAFKIINKNKPIPGDKSVKSFIDSFVDTPCEKTAKLQMIVENLVTINMKNVASGILEAVVAEKREIIVQIKGNRIPSLPPLQKRLLMLIISMAEFNYSIYDEVLKAFEEALTSFRDHTINLTNGFRMASFYTVLCRSHRFLSRARSLIFDLLYARGGKGISIVLKMITIWPFLLPHASFSKNCRFTKVLIHVLLLSGSDRTTKREAAIFKKNLTTKYGFTDLTESSMTRDELFKEVLSVITERGSSLALVLLTKFHSKPWAPTMVDKYLVPILQNWLNKDSDGEESNADIVAAEVALSIGMIARGFPKLTCRTQIIRYIEVFKNMLNKTDNLMVLEAVVEALVLVRRHNLPLTINVLAKWKPKGKVITIKIIELIRSILAIKPFTHWLRFIRNVDP